MEQLKESRESLSFHPGIGSSIPQRGSTTQMLQPTLAPDISLLIAVESRMDGQLFVNALNRPRHRFKVISCVVSKTDFLSSVKSGPVDIALVSESLQDGPLTGFHVLAELRSLSPKTRPIMLLKSDNHDLVVDAFRAGAKGVFCRAESLHVLPKCIRSVHEGQIWVNSGQLNRVMESLANTAPLKLTSASGRRLLTKREEDVVRFVVEGFSNREAANKLGITEHTVSNYLFKVYDKLGISSRVELVLYALKEG